MMSAGTSRESLMRAGATDFLPKPFFLEDVLDCIASNLARTLPNDGRDTVKQLWHFIINRTNIYHVVPKHAHR